MLGFDTATQATAVGLRLSDGQTLRARDVPAPAAHPGHATRLLSLAGELLADAGLGWSGLERIAVGVGPGRFTGLRVGIATARGLAQSLGVELVGVSSLQALGRAAASGGGEPPATIALIDARRGEVFAAAYPPDTAFARERDSPNALLDGEIAFPRALGAHELREILLLIERRAGRRGRGWQAVGDGAVRFREELIAGGVNVAPNDSPLHLLDAGAICELGVCVSSGRADEEVLPDYRRMPDAALAPGRPIALKGART